jgi:hypothetical protein
MRQSHKNPYMQMGIFKSILHGHVLSIKISRCCLRDSHGSTTRMSNTSTQKRPYSRSRNVELPEKVEISIFIFLPNVVEKDYVVIINVRIQIGRKKDR